MTTIPLQIRSQRGRSTRGSACLEPLDPGTRAGKTAGLLIGGILGAAVCIVIPFVHLITTWLLPSVGAYMAWRAWTTPEVLRGVAGSCPDCGAALSWAELGARFPLRESCPGCQSALELRREESEHVQG